MNRCKHILSVMLTAELLVCLGPPASAQTTGVCDRSERVQAAILRALPGNDCAAIDAALLETIDRLTVTSDGSVVRLQAGDFLGLPNLQRLNLINVGLQDFPVVSFSEVSASLARLNLSSNNIQTLPGRPFNGVTDDFRRFNLGDNAIRELPADLLDGVPDDFNLLDVSANPVTRVPAQILVALNRGTGNRLILDGDDVLSGFEYTFLNDSTTLTRIVLFEGQRLGLSIVLPGVPGGIPQSWQVSLVGNQPGFELQRNFFFGLSLLAEVRDDGFGPDPPGRLLEWQLLPDNTSLTSSNPLRVEGFPVVVRESVRLLDADAAPNRIGTGAQAGERVIGWQPQPAVSASAEVAAGLNYHYALSLNPGGLFAIDSASGALSVAPGARLSTATLVSLTVIVTVAGPDLTLPASAPVTVRVGGFSVCGRTQEVRAAILAATDSGSCSLAEGLDSITALTVTGNNVSLQAGDFAGLSQLQSLTLSGIGLRELPPGLFAAVTGTLVRLDLSDNGIQSLPADLLASVRDAFNWLDVSGNPLTRIPAQVLAALDRGTGNRLALDEEDILNGFQYMRQSLTQALMEVSLPEGEIRNLDVSLPGVEGGIPSSWQVSPAENYPGFRLGRFLELVTLSVEARDDDFSNDTLGRVLEWQLLPVNTSLTSSRPLRVEGIPLVLRETVRLSDADAAPNRIGTGAQAGERVIGWQPQPVVSASTEVAAGLNYRYALTVNPGGLFAVDSASGALSVAPGSRLSTATSVSLSVMMTVAGPDLTLTTRTPVTVQVGGFSVCGRTQEVRAAILAATDSGSCSLVEGLDAITALTVTGNNVSLQAGDFAGLSQLQSLTLSGIGLRELPPGLVAAVSGTLVRLDLSDNGIQSLPDDLLAPVRDAFNWLDVSGNPLTRFPVRMLIDLDRGSNNSLTIDGADVLSGLRYTREGDATTLTRLVLYEGTTGHFHVSLPGVPDGIPAGWEFFNPDSDIRACRLTDCPITSGQLDLSIIAVEDSNFRETETSFFFLVHTRDLGNTSFNTNVRRRGFANAVLMFTEGFPLQVREFLALRDADPAASLIAAGAPLDAPIAGWNPSPVLSVSDAVAQTLSYEYALLSGAGGLFVIDTASGALSLAPGAVLPPFPWTRDAVVMITVAGPDLTLTATATVTVAQDDRLWHVCDRTPQVRDAIVAATGAGSCAAVAGPLVLENLPVTGTVHTLRRGDFRGIYTARLTLQNLGLDSLSAEVFEGIRTVGLLNISQNNLDSLPPDVFDQIPEGLCRILLNRNPLTSLPIRALARLQRISLSGLTRLCAPGVANVVADAANPLNIPGSDRIYPHDHMGNVRFIDVNTGRVVSSLVMMEGGMQRIRVELDPLPGVNGELRLSVGGSALNRFLIEPAPLVLPVSETTRTAIEVALTARTDANREHETTDLFWEYQTGAGFYEGAQSGVRLQMRYDAGNRQSGGIHTDSGFLRTPGLAVQVLEPVEITDTSPAAQRIFRGAAVGTGVAGWTPRVLVDGITYAPARYSLVADAGGLLAIDAVSGMLSARAGAWPPPSAQPLRVVVGTDYREASATRALTIGVFDTLTVQDDDVAQNHTGTEYALGAPVRGIRPVVRADGDIVTDGIVHTLTGGQGLFRVFTSSGMIVLARNPVDADAGLYPVTLTASYAGAAASLPLIVVVSAAGRASICDRTPAVQAAILARTPPADDVCGSVLREDLAQITSLTVTGATTTLLPADFHEMPRLHELNLQNLGLTGLPSEIFRSTTALTSVDLRSNDIVFLPLQLLSGFAAPGVQLHIDERVRIGGVRYRMDGETVTGTVLLTEGDTRNLQVEAVGGVLDELMLTLGSSGVEVIGVPGSFRLGPVSATQSVMLVAGMDSDIQHSTGVVRWEWMVEGVRRGMGNVRTVLTPDLPVRVNEIVVLDDVDTAPNRLREDAAGGALVAGWTPQVNVGAGADRQVASGALVRYRLVDDAGGLFDADTASGVLSLAAGRTLNYAASSRHDVVLEVNYDGVTASRSVTIEVLEVTGICGRTDAVEDAILNATPAGDVCGSVLVADLAAITTLTVTTRTAFVTGADFDGLSSLAELDMAAAGAVVLPVQVVARLAGLARWWLDDGARIGNIVYRDDGSGEVITPPLVLDEGASRRLRVATSGGISRVLVFSLNRDALQGVTSTLSRLELGSSSAPVLELTALPDADFIPASGTLVWSWLAPIGLQIESDSGVLVTEGLQIDVTEVQVFSDGDAAANRISEMAPVGGTVAGWSPQVLVRGVLTEARYRLADDADGLFVIDSASGVLSLAGGLDYETSPVHVLEVIAQVDGSGGEGVLSVVIQVDNAPELSFSGVLEGMISEGAAAGTPVSGVRVSLLDDGVLRSDEEIVYQLTGTNAGAFVLEVAGNVAGLALSDTPLDRETTPAYTLTLAATYLGETTSTGITVNVLNVVEEVTLEADPAVYLIDEGAPPGTEVGAMLVVKTEDGVTRTSGVSYALTGSEVFRITPDGAIVVSGAVDYELAASHALTATATYEGVVSDEVRLTVRVRDLSLSLPSVVTGTIAENVAPGTRVSDIGASVLFGVTTVTSLATLELSGVGSDVFRITTDGGVVGLQFAGVTLDRETTPTYTLTLGATYLNETTSTGITVTVLNVVEEVTLEADPAVYSIDEGAPPGTEVGAMLVVKTEDGVTRTSGVSYALTGSEVFRITPDGGIVVSGVVDYELAVSHVLTATATYEGVVSDEVRLTVRVRDLSLSLAPPVAVGMIAENVAPGTRVSDIGAPVLFGVTTVTSLATLELSGVGSDVFRITTDGGVAGLQFAGMTLDRESTPAYSLTLAATYLGETASMRILVVVLDVVEEVTLSVEPTEYHLDEGAPPGTEVGAMLVVKTEDGVTRTSGVTYALTGSEVFRITPDGAIVVSGVVDYELAASHVLTATATYEGVVSDEVRLTVRVRDLSLSLPSVATGTIAENVAPGTMVSDIEASVLFGVTTVTSLATLELSGVGSDVFRITTDGGFVGLQFAGTTLDRETIPVYALTLTATYLNETTSTRITVNVLNVVEEVTLEADPAVYPIDEGAPPGTEVGAMLVVKTEDGVTRTSGVSYALTGSEVFRITPDGAIVVSGVVDYELAASHVLTATATYEGVVSDEVRLTVRVRDLSLSLPSVVTGTIAENVVPGTKVSDIGASVLFGVTTVTSLVTLELSGVGSDVFRITTDGGVVGLRFSGVTLDRESTPAYSLTLAATYLGETASMRIAVTVLNVVEEVTLSVEPTEYQIDEGAPPGTEVGAMLVVKTEDGVTRTSGVSYALTGSEVFRITPDGAIVVSGVVDYELAASHVLTATATYEGVVSDEVRLTVRVRDLSLSLAPPVATGTIAENVAPGTMVSDIEASVLFGVTTVTSLVTLELSGAGSDVFLITTDGGVVGLQFAGVTLDHETTPIYTLTLAATYLGETASLRITVTVLSVVEEVTLEADSAVYPIDEGAPPGTDVGAMLVVKTEDGVTRTSGVSYALTGSEVFRITPDGAIVVSGVVDYELAASHVLTATATYEGVVSDEVRLTVRVRDLSLSLPSVATGTIAENVAPGTRVSDIGASVLFGVTTVTSLATLELSGVGSDVFRITTDGGFVGLRFAGVTLDRETTPAYALTLTASYLGETTSTRIAVNVLNVVEEVTLTPDSVVYPIDEGAPSGTGVGAMLVVKTEDGVTRTSGVTWQISPSRSPFMVIGGEIVSTRVFDVETDLVASYTLGITATYEGVASGEVPVVIRVTDLSLSLHGTPASGGIVETAPPGATVPGLEVSALFGETTVTTAAAWRLSGTGSETFRVTTDAGVVRLRLVSSLDRETTPAYTLTLSASYLGEAASAGIAVAVLNVVESVTLEADSATYRIDEGAPPGTDVGVTLVVRTEAGAIPPDEATYALTGSGVFGITEAGRVVVAGALDYEETTSHRVMITALYAGVTSNEVGITIAVNDLALSLQGSLSGGIVETASPDTAVPGLEVSALFGETTVTTAVAWRLSGTGSETFRITTDTGVVRLRLASPLDYETTPAYILMLSASYPGEAASIGIAVAVLNAVESVTLEADETVYQIDEGAPPGTDVGAMLVVKTEDGVTRTSGVSYALIGSEVFRITPNGGIVVSGAVDYELAASHVLTATATYRGVVSDEVRLTVRVRDLSLSLPSVVTGTIVENVAPGTRVSDIGAPVLFGVTTVTSLATLELSGAGSDVFRITTDGGVVGLQFSGVTLDRETIPAYSLTLTASYLGETTSTRIAVNVLNVVEEVTLTPDSAVYPIDEGAPSGTDVGAMLVVKTEDGVTRTSGVSYALTGSEVFRITPDGGIVVSGVVDYELAASHVLTATATYEGVVSDEVRLTVRVRDLSLLLSPSVVTGTIAENVAPGTRVSDIGASVLFGVTTVTSLATLELSGVGSDVFRITTDGGFVGLRFSGVTLDRETIPAYALTLTASYLGETTSTRIAVNILNVVESVTLTPDSAAYPIDEGAPSGTGVGAMLVVKTEDGVTRTSGVTWQISPSRSPFMVIGGEIVSTRVFDVETDLAASYTLGITATYEGVASGEVPVIIRVTDLSLSLHGTPASGRIVETASPGATVPGLEVSALFGEATVTTASAWRLSGTGSETFRITTDTGVVRLRLVSPLDRETTPAYTLTLSASYLGEAASTGIAVAVLNTVESVTLAADETVYPIDEGAPPGTDVGVTLVVRTEAGVVPPDEATYALTGSGVFGITEAGRVVVAGALDYEETPSHRVMITALYEGVTSNEVGITIDVNDLSLSLQGSLSGGIVETASPGTAVPGLEVSALFGETTVTTAAAWRLSGTGSETFRITTDAGVVRLRLAAPLDRETTPAYTLMLSASYLDEAASAGIAVAVLNAVESVTLEADSAVYPVNEGAPPGTDVGVTLVVKAEDGVTRTSGVTYALAGSGVFGITETGRVVVSGALDYEETTSHRVMITALYEGVTSNEVGITIAVNDLALSLQGSLSGEIIETATPDTTVSGFEVSALFGEATVTTASAWRLSGTGSEAFRITTDTGVVRLRLASPLDRETTPTYTLTLSASYLGEAASTGIAVAVLNAVESVTLEADSVVYPINEGAPPGTGVGAMLVVKTEDGVTRTSGVTWQISPSLSPFMVIGGEIVSTRVFDVETDLVASYTLGITATYEGVASNEVPVSIRVTDLSLSLHGTPASGRIAETASPGTTVSGLEVSALFGETTVTTASAWRLSGTAPDVFRITTDAGVVRLRLVSPLDRETTPAYTLTLSASYLGEEASTGITVTVLNVVESVTLEADSAIYRIDEGAPPGTGVGAMLVVKTEDGVTRTSGVTWRISPSLSPFMVIGGEIVSTRVFDVETDLAASYTLGITATYEGVASGEVPVVIGVTDLSLSLHGTPASGGIVETASPDTTVLGLEVSALFGETAVTTAAAWRLSGVGSETFRITTDTGVVRLRLVSPLDRETTPAYTLTLSASYLGEAASTGIAVAVLNAVESVTLEADSATYRIDEGAPLGTEVGAPLIVNTEAGVVPPDEAAYELTGSGVFDITEDGRVVVSGALDYEETPSHRVMITALYAGVTSDEVGITIAVNDLSLSLQGSLSGGITETASPDTTVPGLEVSALFGETTVTTAAVWGLSGTGSDVFRITTDTGVVRLRLASSLDREITPSYTLTLSASYLDEEAGAGIAVTVLNVVESVTLEVDSATYRIDEGAPPGTGVGAMLVVKTEEGVTRTSGVTWQISPLLSPFIVIGGEIVSTRAFDVETDLAVSYTLGITATYEGVASNEVPVVIRVADLSLSLHGTPASGGIVETASPDTTVLGLEVSALFGETTVTTAAAWRLSGTGSETFRITTDTGVVRLRLVSPLDRETTPAYTLTLSASYLGEAASTGIAVAVLNTVESVTLAADETVYPIDEGAPPGTDVGVTLVVNTEAGVVPPDEATYALTGSGVFDITETGRVIVSGALDYEEATSHQVMITALYAGVTSDEVGITIAVNDLALSLQGSLSGGIVETALPGATVPGLEVSALFRETTVTTAAVWRLSGVGSETFRITTDTGVVRLRLVSSLDRETTPTYTLTLSASYPGEAASTGIVVTVLNAVESVTLEADSVVYPIEEGAPPGTDVGAMLVVKTEDGVTRTSGVTYALAGSGVFGITETGRVVVSGALDYEETTSHRVMITALYEGVTSNEVGITIAVNDLALSLRGSLSGEIMETAAPDTAVSGFEVSALFGETTVTTAAAWGLSGTGSETFRVTTDAGVVRLRLASPLDRETTPAYTLMLSASYLGEAASTGIVVTVLNAVEEVTLEADSTVYPVNEGAPPGTEVGVMLVVKTEDGVTRTSGVTYALAGSGVFGITEAGRVVVSGALDYEETTSHRVMITALYEGVTSNEVGITIAVEDLALSLQGSLSGEIMETATPGTTVSGLEVSALFGETTVTTASAWRLSGTGSKAFRITTDDGVVRLRLALPLDRETTPAYTLTLSASYLNEAASSGIAVTVLNAVESVTLEVASVAYQIDEGAPPGTGVGAMLVVKTEDGVTRTSGVTWQISPSLSPFIVIGGEIVSTRVFDVETDLVASYTLGITATYEGVASGEVPVIISVTDLSLSLHGTPASGRIVETASPDTTVPGLEVSALFGETTVTTASAWVLSGTGSETFRITTDAGVVRLRLASPLDYETTPAYTLTLSASYLGEAASTGIAVAVLNVVESVTLEADSAVYPIEEGAPSGTDVGVTLVVKTEDGVTRTSGVTYALAGSGVFGITEAGRVVVSGALDYEEATSHRVMITALYAGVTSNEVGITIAVNDLALSLRGSLSGEIIETASPGTTVSGFEVSALFGETTVTTAAVWRLSGTGSETFRITTDTGVARLRLASPLDRGTTPAYTLTLSASHLSDESASTRTTVTVLNTLDEVTLVADAAVYPINEGAPLGTDVGVTLVVKTGDGVTRTSGVTYALAGSGVFGITEAGRVVVSGALDYEETTSHRVMITALYEGVTSNEVVITIAVEDLALSLQGSLSGEIIETATPDTAVSGFEVSALFGQTTVTTAAAWGLSGTGSETFHLTTDTGVVRLQLASPLDYETTPAYALTLSASYSGESTSTQVIIAVLNVNELTIEITGTPPFTITENTPPGTRIGDVLLVARTEDGIIRTSEVVWHTSGADNLFRITSAGAVTVAGALDYEASTSHTPTITASWQSMTSNAERLTILVVNVERDPHLVDTNGAPNAALNTTDARVAGLNLVLLLDGIPQTGGVSWVFDAANTPVSTINAFAINPATGAITLQAPLATLPQTYEATVTATTTDRAASLPLSIHVSAGLTVRIRVFLEGAVIP